MWLQNRLFNAISKYHHKVIKRFRIYEHVVELLLYYLQIYIVTPV